MLERTFESDFKNVIDGVNQLNFKTGKFIIKVNQWKPGLDRYSGVSIQCRRQGSLTCGRKEYI